MSSASGWERDASARAIVVDASPLDAAAKRHFAPFAERLQFVIGDVGKAETWAGLPTDAGYVVHGAAVTPMRYIDAEGRPRNPEREDPLRVIEANILGTARALDWARRLPALTRFVYVSTGSVYADLVPAQESDPFPLPEDGYIGPIALYDITKYGGELLTQRFAELYDMPAYTVRLASVFGPMDRATPFRNVRNAANHVAHAAAAGRPVRATTADAVGDYIYAPDVADAIHRMLAVPARAPEASGLQPGLRRAEGHQRAGRRRRPRRGPASSWRSSRRPRPTSRSPTSARPGAGAPMTSRAPRRISAGSRVRWRRPSPTISTGSAPMRAEASSAPLKSSAGG